MTSEQKDAYEWALNQNYQSVAAGYDKALAEYISSLPDVEHPARISLEALKPCGRCRDLHSEKIPVKLCGEERDIHIEVGKVNRGGKTGAMVFLDNKLAAFTDFDYCPYCGRPQTAEALEALEQRLMGSAK